MHSPLTMLWSISTSWMIIIGSRTSLAWIGICEMPRSAHTLGDFSDRLVPSRELDVAGLELEQLAHRAQALLGTEKAHVAHPLVVVAFAEIAIAGVGDDHDDGLAGAEAARDVERAVDRGAGGAAREDALATRELACGEEGILVRHLENLVDDPRSRGSPP